jgi:hypothetical protein
MHGDAVVSRIPCTLDTLPTLRCKVCHLPHKLLRDMNVILQNTSQRLPYAFAQGGAPPALPGWVGGTAPLFTQAGALPAGAAGALFQGGATCCGGCAGCAGCSDGTPTGVGEWGGFGGCTGTCGALGAAETPCWFCCGRLGLVPSMHLTAFTSLYLSLPSCGPMVQMQRPPIKSSVFCTYGRLIAKQYADNWLCPIRFATSLV